MAKVGFLLKGSMVLTWDWLLSRSI